MSVSELCVNSWMEPAQSSDASQTKCLYKKSEVICIHQEASSLLHVSRLTAAQEAHYSCFLMGSHLHCAWGLSWSLTVCLEVASLVCIFSCCCLAKCQKFCWMCLGIYFGRSAFPEPMRPIWWRWTLSSQHPVLSQKFMISAFIPNLYLVYWCFHCLVYNSHFLLSNQSSYIVFGMFLPLQISGIELYETTSSHTSLSAFPFPDIPQ